MHRLIASFARLVVIANVGAVVPTAGAAGDDTRTLPPATDLVIGLDDAVSTVQSRFPATKVLESRIARHGSRWVYLVRSARGSTVRTFKFDAFTGATLVNKRETARGARLERIRQEIRLLSAAATTKLEAIAAAEAALPGAKAYEVELDDLNNVPVYKVKLLDGIRRVVVIVSAAEGVVVPMPSDGVVDLSFDDAVTRAEASFAGWGVVRVELDDDRNFDDSGSSYQVRLASADGSQRRDVKLDANTGAILRNRVSSVSESKAAEFRQIVAATPAVSFGKAAMVAADSVPGSRVHEVELDLEDSGLVYRVELIKSDGTSAAVLVSPVTGQIVTPSTPTPTPTPGTAITAAQAAAIAMARVPGTTVREISLDTEEGVPVYEVSLVSASGERTDVQVAVATGQVVRVRAKS